jgi:hypothetical protein
MALALLRWQGPKEAYHDFQAEIGRNRYYQIAIAADIQRNVNGLALLSMPKYISRLMGPFPETHTGRFNLQVPHRYFDHSNQYVQLMSFRTAQREGPALSEILTVEPTATSDPSTLDESATMIELETFMNDINRQPVDSVAFSVEDDQLSSSMFLGTILSGLTSILPSVLPVVGNLLGGLFGNKGESSSTTSDAGSSNSNITQLLQTLMSQISAAKPNSTAQSYSEQSGNRLIALATQLSKEGSINRHNGTEAVNTNPPEGAVAEEMALPALAFSTIPALMPVLEYTIAPQTLRSLTVNAPPRVALGTIEHGLHEVGRIAPYWREERASEQHNFHRVEAVRLEFTGANSVMLQGRSRMLYAQNQEITFPLRVTTPKPISQAKLVLVITEPESRQVLLKQGYPVMRQVTTGTLAVEPTLSTQQLAKLPANREYLVTATLLWQGRSQDTRQSIRLGTSMTQLITLLDEYCFDRIEGEGERISLNDVTRFRPYWHKVWQGNLRDDMRRLTLDCRYYYTLDGERTNNARMETLTRIEPTDSTRQSGRLKTGMLLSPYRLNELLEQVSDYPPLAEEELAALMDPEFKNQFSQVAQTSVKFKGQPGKTVALWLYPEFTLQHILLKKVEQTNSNGQVIGISEHSVHLPVPATVHFVGTET